MSRSGFANRASSCALWAEMGERRAFLCGRWVLEVGIDWGMFSDILSGLLVAVWRTVRFCWSLSQSTVQYVHMPKDGEMYGGL
jgi:hypothetical protein